MDQPKGPLELTAAERDVVAILDRIGPTSGRDVYEELDDVKDDVVYVSTTNILAALEEREFVRSKPNPENRRKNIYELTAEGVRAHHADLDWRDSR